MDPFEKIKHNIESWSDLYFYQEDFKLMLLAERKVIENAEQFINNLKQELKLQIENNEELKVSPPTPEEAIYQEQFLENRYGTANKIINQVLQNQRKATVLLIFSLFEGHLKTLCNLAQNEFPFKIKLNDIHGSDDIHKYLVYLEKVYEIDYSQLEPVYTPIKQLKYFRNKIAHNNSKIEAKKIQLVYQTQGLTATTYGDYYEINIADIEFIQNLINQCELFFDRLTLLMDKRYKVIKQNIR